MNTPQAPPPDTIFPALQKNKNRNEHMKETVKRFCQKSAIHKF